MRNMKKKKHRARIASNISKNDKEKVRTIAEKLNISMSKYVEKAIIEKLLRDNRLTSNIKYKKYEEEQKNEN